MTTTIAEISFEGCYGFVQTHKLIRTAKGSTYLLTDHWCGSDLEGQCYRAHVSEVPADRVQEIVGYLTPDALVMDDQGNSRFQWLLMHIVSDLRDLGRASHFAWAS